MKLLKHLYYEYIHDEIGSLAAQTSYFLILAFFPSLIAILSIIGNLNLPADEIFNTLASILPNDTYDLVYSILDEIVRENSISLVSIFLGLLFSTRGVRAIVIAINKSYCEEEARSSINLWILSLVFTVILVFILITTLVLLVFGQKIGGMLEMLFGELYLYNPFRVLWNYLRYLLPITSMIFAFSFIYKRAPSCNRKLKYKDIIWGSVFTTVSWTIASLIYAYYINNYNTSYSSIYGGLSGIFILLVWLYITSTIIILGGEINAYLYRFKK